MPCQECQDAKCQVGYQTCQSLFSSRQIAGGDPTSVVESTVTKADKKLVGIDFKKDNICDHVLNAAK